jgi:DNA invertase Pin-like site-specific DNA recombinase
MKAQNANLNQLAISYVRYSSVGQSDGDSVRRQLEATEAYCRKHGLTLTDKYRLQDSGKSAFHGVNRKDTSALGQFEIQVAAGEIPNGTVLIVENLDRLSREEISEALALLLNLIRKGIEIVALSDNERRYTKASVNANPMELVMSIMVLARAHEESKIKSYRIKASWLNRKKLASEGKHINVQLPGWLENKNGEYVLDDSKAKTIKRIVQLSMKGYGGYTISTMLRKDGTPNISRPQNGKRKSWHPLYIARILKNKALIGTYTVDGIEIPNYFPRILSDTEYYACLSKLKERSRYKGQRSNNPQPFSHLLKCSLCGESIFRVKTNDRIYLQCYGNRAGSCNSSYMDYPSTFNALLTVISEIDPSAVVPDDNALLKAQREIEALRGKLIELNGKIEKAEKMFEDDMTESGKHILCKLNADKILVTQQLESASNVKYLSDHRNDWRQVKARLEGEVEKTYVNPHNIPIPLLKENGLYPTIIPLSIIQNDSGEIEFIRHTDAEPTDDIIALRECLRQYIDRININIPNMQADIRFKNGKQVTVNFKKTKQYPRRYYYKTADKDWTEIGRK